jgi:hypothetical protein
MADMDATANEICGFRLDCPTGEPRFICVEPPHPDRPHFHGNERASYNEQTRQYRRGVHYERA